jgi:hypothetical protein
MGRPPGHMGGQSIGPPSVRVKVNCCGPEAASHLELIDDPQGKTVPSPTDEDPLVLNGGEPVDPDLIGRLVDSGGERVRARNP